MPATQEALKTLVHETGGWVAAQLEACTRCGMCAEACHFYQATGNPEYAPVWKLELLRRAYEQRFTPVGALKVALGVEKRISDADLRRWSELNYHACTVCNKCALVCPMGIDLGSLLHTVRAGLAAAGAVPADLTAAVTKQVNEGSPLGMTDKVWDQRLEWVADEWEVEIPRDVQGADTLVIFSSIEVMKFPGTVAAIAKILNAAGEKWTVSSQAREVVNFGFYEGSQEHTQLFLQRVLDGARALGVKRIVVTECGHAYDALRWHAANWLPEANQFEITHITGVLGALIGSGRIKVKPGAFDQDGVLTFHDACKIQRKGGHLQEPRAILGVLAPQSFKELTPNREEALCCGGGGGVIAIKAADEVRYAAFRLKIDQVRKVGAKTVAMSCSNCRLQFTDGVEHFKLDWKITGLAQMVADALVE
jgi:Fe-S oxidoreductase